jgi:hypothetical protein
VTEQTLVEKENPIAVYKPFYAELAQLKKDSKSLVFDYEDPKQIKEARSHIHKWRLTKGAIERARKAEKQESLDYGRLVDSEAKRLTNEVQEIIDDHEGPILEIEQREKDRIATHQANMDRIQQYADGDWSGYDAERLEGLLKPIDEMQPDEAYEEFTAPALSIWKQAREKVVVALEARRKYESEQAELERLRAEQAAREQKEREAKIAQEAAEKARIEAEAKAKAEAEAAERKAQEEREAAAKREAEAKAAQERAEQARIAAEAKAIQDAIDAERRQAEAVEAAEKRAKQQAEEAKQREIAEAKKREDNQKHKAKINNEALADFVKGGLNEDQAKLAVTLIAQRSIRNVEIKY